jgi:hypothetical protein
MGMLFGAPDPRVERKWLPKNFYDVEDGREAEGGCHGNDDHPS